MSVTINAGMINYDYGLWRLVVMRIRNVIGFE